MRLPTSDQTLSTPVIGTIAAVIVVLLVLALLALRGGDEDDGVDLGGAAAADGEASQESAPASDEPSTIAGQSAGPSPDASSSPPGGAAEAAADLTSVATPSIPLGDPDTGGAPADGALTAGTCIDDDGRASDTASATAVDCAVDHTGEVFATTTVTLPPDAAYPGADALEVDTRGLCQGPAFEEYIGTPHDDSALFTYALIPTEESWAAGDRAIVCVAFHPMERTVGSVRGSGR